MANKVKGEARVVVGDEEYILVMDFEMRCQVEDLCDKPFHQVAEDASKGFHRAIRAILWAALQRNHPDMTMGQVTELIEEHGEELKEGMEKAAEAAAISEPKGKAKEGKDKNPPRGKTSGNNGVRLG